MLEGRVPPADVLTVLTAAAPRETTELNLQQILDGIRSAFWRFTPPDDRPAAARTLEPMLRAGLARAPSTSAKAAWFGALRSTATTAETLQWLERVWRREIRIPGLRLSEIDEADLAADLALREVPADRRDSRHPARASRESGPEGALQVRHACTVAGRRLRGIASSNRSAMSATGHARRGCSTPHATCTIRCGPQPRANTCGRRSSLVREIQRTGDIFFPKRWADATVSGYQSVQTAAEVRSFIDGLPADYPPRLRWALLASADPLFRAARFTAMSH